MKKTAFTLSEALTTIVIIGVIAAITMPLLNGSLSKDKQYKAQLKREYTILSEAFINNSYFENFTDWNYEHSNACTLNIFNKLSQVLNVSKVCGAKYTDNECFKPVKNQNGNYAFFFTKDGFAANWGHLYTFSLNDGASVALDIWSSASVETYAGINKDFINSSHVLMVLLDVNGPDKPNIAGKDVFLFALTNKGLVPAGSNNKAKCGDNGANYVYYCTYKMLRDK